MKKRCCRSAPRCRDCPVRVLAEQRASTARAGLVTEILGGRSPAPLPPTVEAALADLDAARGRALQTTPTR
jgi:hypothetical protein